MQDKLHVASKLLLEHPGDADGHVSVSVSTNPNPQVMGEGNIDQKHSGSSAKPAERIPSCVHELADASIHLTVKLSLSLSHTHTKRSRFSCQPAKLQFSVSLLLSVRWTATKTRVWQLVPHRPSPLHPDADPEPGRTCGTRCAA